MKIIVVTSSKTVDNEHKIIEQMFRRGLKYLHVRKPGYSREKMISYISKFNPKYRENIILHSHHSLALSMKLKGIHLKEKHRKNFFLVWKVFNLYRLRRRKLQITTSFHNLSDVTQYGRRYDYSLFSPVFESISKEDYQPKYSLASIYDTLEKTTAHVIAMGGVDDDKVMRCYEARFRGVAISGFLWQSDDPIGKFEIVKEKCLQYKISS